MSQVDIEHLIDQYNSKLSSVLPKAVASNLGIWLGLSFATVIAFNILRPRNKVVYEPKTKYHVNGKEPPRIQNGFFSWVSPLIHTREPVLLDKIGLDAVTFLRFLRMVRWLFLCIAVVSCLVLLPINLVANQSIEASKKNSLSVLTIENVQGSYLFAHVSITYVNTLLVIGFVWFHWKQMVRLRHEWYRSDEYAKSFYARTLLVQSVPKSIQSDSGLLSLFEQLRMPYPTTSVHIGRRVGELPNLVEFHNDNVRLLEQVLVTHLRDGKIGKKRPTIRIGGFLGMGGIKKDAIDYYTTKLRMTEKKIENLRANIDLRKIENYGFASMAAVPYAHTVAKLMDGKHPKGTTITLAPNPKDIIWKNLTMTNGERTTSQIFGWLWLGLVCFVNTIPLLFISLLANLGDVAQYFDFLDDWRTSSEWSFSLASGVLPPTISAIFGFILPIIMRSLSRYQGAITRSRLDRAVVARYFAFLVISQFLIFSLFGALFKLAKDVIIRIIDQEDFWTILKTMDALPSAIQASYTQQSNYWLTFFPLRGFLAVFDLAQLLNLLWIWIKTHLFGRTPRDIREWTQPPNFDYAIYYSNLLFMAVVGFVYAPLAPLVVLATAVVFWISSIVYKYQLMFVFTTSIESGGRLWNVVINRLLSGTIFMHLIMLLTIGLNHGWGSYLWVSTVPPMLFVFAFKLYINHTFFKQFQWYIPKDGELAINKVHSESADRNGNRLEKRFGHPALHADLFTPLLHAKMMKLLPDVYRGKLAQDHAVVGEYGGQKMEAQIMPGGLKIAAVEQSDLEYDPAFYQRDRGELNWDRHSIASTHILGEDGTLRQSSYGAYGGQKSHPAGYQDYLSHGARSSLGNAMELARLDSRTDVAPLLAPSQSQFSQSTSDLAHPQWAPPGYSSQTSLVDEYGRQGTPQPPLHRQFATEPGRAPSYESIPQAPLASRSTDGIRTAPTHRPAPPQRQMTADGLGGAPGPHYPPRRQQTFDGLGGGGAPPPSRGHTPEPLGQYPPRQRTPEPGLGQYPRQRTPEPGMGQYPRQRTPEPLGQYPPRQRTPEPLGQYPPRQRTPEPMGQQYPRQRTPEPMGQYPARQRTPEPLGQFPPRQQTPESIGGYSQRPPRGYPPARYQTPDSYRPGSAGGQSPGGMAGRGAHGHGY